MFNFFDHCFKYLQHTPVLLVVGQRLPTMVYSLLVLEI